MAIAQANGIEIEYEVIGQPDAPPLLLVMGLGAQLIGWDDDFCLDLARQGFRVVRFDNRDVGLSTKFDHLGLPNLLEAAAKHASGQPIEAAYTLWDMAEDAAGLLDALRIEKAHIVGASMGGMIAQCFAIRHTERVVSLTSIMSTTGAPDLPAPTPEATGILLSPGPSDRAGNIERAVTAGRVLSGGGFPFEEERIRRAAERAYDRSFYPPGPVRQLIAIVGSSSRREALARVTAPALVIHGDADPLIPVSGGIDTHQALSGSELVIIGGMGHELPSGAWPRIISGIASVAARASAPT